MTPEKKVPPRRFRSSYESKCIQVKGFRILCAVRSVVTSQVGRRSLVASYKDGVSSFAILAFTSLFLLCKPDGILAPPKETRL